MPKRVVFDDAVAAVRATNAFLADEDAASLCAHRPPFGVHGRPSQMNGLLGTNGTSRCWPCAESQATCARLAHELRARSPLKSC